MRKLAVMALSGAMLLTLAGCGSTAENKTTEETTAQADVAQTTQAETQKEQETTTEAFAGVNTLSLYIYNKDTGYREISEGYNSTWVKGEDIVSFEAYATDDDKFSLGGSNFKNVWQSYWQSYDHYDSCKLGYTIDFTLKDGQKIHKTILGPDDVFDFRDYLECYLYDDVNQIQGNWYSHLLDTQVTDATVMTSIKFTAGVNMEEMGDTITLTAFVYSTDENDFDANGDYTGPVSYTVTVRNTAN